MDLDFAQLFIELGAIKVLALSIGNPQTRKKPIVKGFLELANILGSSPNFSGKILADGAFEFIIQIIQDVALTDNNVCSALETLSKLGRASPKYLSEKNYMLPQILEILKMKISSSQVVLAGLKLLETFSKSKCSMVCLRDGSGVNILVELMEQHPYEKNVLKLGAAVLGCVATVEDLKNALENIKNGRIIYKYNYYYI